MIYHGLECLMASICLYTQFKSSWRCNDPSYGSANVYDARTTYCRRSIRRAVSLLSINKMGSSAEGFGLMCRVDIPPREVRWVDILLQYCAVYINEGDMRCLWKTWPPFSLGTSAILGRLQAGSGSLAVWVVGETKHLDQLAQHTTADSNTISPLSQITCLPGK